MTRDEFKAALEHAPGVTEIRVAHGLAGWTTESGEEYCSTCVGRVMARGFSDPLPGSTPIWAAPGRDVHCAACGFVKQWNGHS